MAAPPALLLATTGKRVLARAVDAMLHAVVFFLPFLWVESDRPLARILVGLTAMTVYEAAFVGALGATPGKLIAGIRVVQVDHPRVEPTVAVRRGVVAALSTLLVVSAPLVLFAGVAQGGAGALLGVGALALAAGAVMPVLTSPLHQGMHDRACATLVVDRTTPLLVPGHVVDALEVQESHVVVGPWGRAAGFDERRRARAARLDDSPVLVVLLLAIAFTTSLPTLHPGVIVGMALLWVATFVADETWRITRYGTTAGHRRMGLCVVDADTGEPPPAGRALVRAVLVAVPLYVLPGLVLGGLALSDRTSIGVFVAGFSALLLAALLLWIRRSDGRSLHDVAANTIVVAAPGAGWR